MEVLSLERMRVRGGPTEFLTPQRLDFDMLLRIDDGATTHTVDFTEHALGAGDVLWVRAGQMHQWGRIGDIDGPSVLFAAHAIDDRTRELVRAAGTAIPNVWPASDIEGTPVAEAWELLLSVGRQATPGGRADLRNAALAHATGALLTQLALAQPADQTTGPTATHEAYIWFRDEIDRRFSEWHQVTHYADRLGYSPRTLNRLARAHTGRSAKQLIDERVVLEAKRLLSHGDAPVVEIAEQLGFDDPSNFSAYFRARAGVTPGAFRRTG
ncbi:AraC family transcriptional regulator [Aeromicrobium sp. 9AM]|uniref:helix-turn-helix transcriptional regulator n=1 Tax=Aeromicrobium sp. 9AM TaxID=2653126 RepID=UPI001916A04C|nr:AraC family transcriptional regulator [Aeromicrobium sp. 9AM]